MKALAQLAAEIREDTKSFDKLDRDTRIDNLCLELVGLRPSYEEAILIAASLKVGLALRESPYGDDLPLEVDYKFHDLAKVLDAQEQYEPDPYSPEED
jgi:hypothetical protein